ncbi:MAG: hypothetical protein U5N55_10080 [Cypionkella sp.]|nr:hypothetical protein [Cypionkella sp.]
MIKRLIALLIFVASPALATPVEVTTGEHAGFTRVVLNFGTAIDWEFGRTNDGYRFRPRNLQATYDLQSVFKRIGNSRLAAISSDPVTSELDIGFACACHAIPFEFRSGIVVIDLRDGPPPNGSSFETELPKRIAALPQPEAVNAVSGPTGYNWLQVAREKSQAPSPDAAPDLAILPSSAPDLQPLREQLLRQLSRGASEGVIDLDLPQNQQPLPPKAEVQAARIALEELGGVQTKTAREPQIPLGAQGAECLSNEDLALHDWGADNGVGALLSQDMTALVGEFDTPEPTAITRAVKARLFLGFGQEARQIMQAFPEAAKNEPTLMALSYLVDGQADPTGGFQGQGHCETSAALWASISDPKLTARSQVNGKAVTLAFAALPRHLRHLLGPSLIERFLALKDNETASSLSNIMMRAGPQDTAQIAVSQAKIDLAKGDAVGAERHLDNLGDDAKNANTLATAEAAITRVQARIAQGLPVEKDAVAALAAMQSEMHTTDLGPKIAVAKLHAQAASGDFAAAFAGLADLPSEAPTVLQVLASLADDSDLLIYAISSPPDVAAAATAETAQIIAQRLLDLGLPNYAQDWMKIGRQDRGLLLARIEIARQDARAALAALEGDNTILAAELRAAAYTIIGDFGAAARALKDAPESAQVFALAQANDWIALAKGPQSAWMDLARGLVQDGDPVAGQVDTFGPLARGLSLAEKSAHTRKEVSQLLNAVALPQP